LEVTISCIANGLDSCFCNSSIAGLLYAILLGHTQTIAKPARLS